MTVLSDGLKEIGSSSNCQNNNWHQLSTDVPSTVICLMNWRVNKGKLNGSAKHKIINLFKKNIIPLVDRYLILQVQVQYKRIMLKLYD